MKKKVILIIKPKTPTEESKIESFLEFNNIKYVLVGTLAHKYNPREKNETLLTKSQRTSVI